MVSRSDARRSRLQAQTSVCPPSTSLQLEREAEASRRSNSVISPLVHRALVQIPARPATAAGAPKQRQRMPILFWACSIRKILLADRCSWTPMQLGGLSLKKSQNLSV